MTSTTTRAAYDTLGRIMFISCVEQEFGVVRNSSFFHNIVMNFAQTRGQTLKVPRGKTGHGKYPRPHCTAAVMGVPHR